jgi:hypothetical protein
MLFQLHSLYRMLWEDEWLVGTDLEAGAHTTLADLHVTVFL